MKTKYGQITTEQFEKYRSSVIGRIYAIMPMKEEGIDTVGSYIESLNRELVSNMELFENCERVLSVICILNYLIDEDNHDCYRKEVLHCCNIMEKVGESDV